MLFSAFRLFSAVLRLLRSNAAFADNRIANILFSAV